jgi:hypothetical protein
LPEDGAVRAVFYNGFPGGDSSQEGFPIDRLAFLSYLLACHNNLFLLGESAPVVSKGIRSADVLVPAGGTTSPNAVSLGYFKIN